MDDLKATFLFGAVPDDDDLDPDDPDDREELMSRQDPGRSEAVVVAHEILATQIAEEDPPEVWATARRLLDLGMDRAGVMSQLSVSLGQAVRLSLAGGNKAFDPHAYVALLGSLPLPAIEEIEAAIVDVVRGSQQIGADELTHAVVAMTGRAEDDELASGLVHEVMDDLVDEDGPLAWLPEGGIVHVTDFTAGIVLTHRLSEGERLSGDLLVSFDLAGFRRRDDLRLADGSQLEWDIDDSGAQVWWGPDGWLSGWPAGAVLAVRVDGDGVVGVDELGDEPALDASFVDRLRTAYDAAVAEPWLPVNAEDLVLGMLAGDRATFDRPLPPLDELCAAAGLERRGDRVAHDAGVWATGEQIGRMRWVYDSLDDVNERMVAMRVLGAAAEPAPSPEQVGQALVDLAEPAVAHAVVDALARPGAGDDGTGDADRFAQALVAVARTARQIGIARWVAAVVAERAGEVLVADGHLKIALDAGKAWPPLLERAGWYASDRGDAPTALRLWRMLAEPDPRDIATLEPFAHRRGPKLGRNDPCWCGSGRKYKGCHLGRPQAVPLPDRVGWLWRKAGAHLEHRPDAGLLMVALAATRAGDAADFEAVTRAFADPIVADVALTEGDWFVRFLEDRGPLLPDDEALLAEAWALVARTVYEVLEVVSGTGLTVRDVRTGDHLVVRERTFSGRAVAGMLVCARAVPDGESHQFVGALFPVAPGREAALLDLCDAGDPVAICEWVAALHRPPTLITREHEPMVSCTAVVELGDAHEARAALDRRYDREGDEWTEMHRLDGGDRILRAHIILEGTRARVTTHAEPRMDRLLATLTEEISGARVVSDERVPLRPGEMPTPPFSVDPNGPAPSAANVDFLAEIQDRFERNWVEESIPALAGLTPRQAADDPTRRGELERLIASFPDPAQLPPGGISMRPDRLRSLLGLGDQGAR